MSKGFTARDMCSLTAEWVRNFYHHLCHDDDSKQDIQVLLQQSRQETSMIIHVLMSPKGYPSRDLIALIDCLLIKFLRIIINKKIIINFIMNKNDIKKKV